MVLIFFNLDNHEISPNFVPSAGNLMYKIHLEANCKNFNNIILQNLQHTEEMTIQKLPGYHAPHNVRWLIVSCLQS